MRFGFDNTRKMGLDSTCFAIGEKLEYLCCVLNSPMGHYLLKDAPKTGTGDLFVSVQAVEPILVPCIGDDVNKDFAQLLQSQSEGEIAKRVFKLYGLSPEEVAYIEENFT